MHAAICHQALLNDSRGNCHHAVHHKKLMDQATGTAAWVTDCPRSVVCRIAGICSGTYLPSSSTNRAREKEAVSPDHRKKKLDFKNTLFLSLVCGTTKNCIQLSRFEEHLSPQVHLWCSRKMDNTVLTVEILQHCSHNHFLQM